MIVAERPSGTFTRQVFLGETWTPSTSPPITRPAS